MKARFRLVVVCTAREPEFANEPNRVELMSRLGFAFGLDPALAIRGDTL